MSTKSISVSELSWLKKPPHPSKIVQIKNKIKVKILEIDSEKRRFNCSLKKLKENPWDSVKEKFKVGDVIDTKIVNIGIKFIAVVSYEQDKFEALNKAVETIQEMFTNKNDVGQPIYLSNIYNELNNLDEIVDVIDVKIVNDSTVGGRYSDVGFNLKNYISADGRILFAPEDVVYELKYPSLDIKGTIR